MRHSQRVRVKRRGLASLRGGNLADLRARREQRQHGGREPPGEEHGAWLGGLYDIYEIWRMAVRGGRVPGSAVGRGDKVTWRFEPAAVSQFSAVHSSFALKFARGPVDLVSEPDRTKYMY